MRTADEEGILSSGEDRRMNTSDNKTDIPGATRTKPVMMGELAAVGVQKVCEIKWDNDII